MEFPSLGWCTSQALLWHACMGLGNLYQLERQHDLLWWGGGTANNETHWQPLLLPQIFDKLLKFRNQSGNLFSRCTDVAFSKEIVDTCMQASILELTSGLKITDSRSPVMMTDQILFSPHKQCYRAKRIKRQLYGKYYEMFASKNDRSKWPARREFDRWSPRSGRTLSIDRPLFWALYLNINLDKCVERYELF